ncbi:hypothetical protein FRB96_003247 [Tulasnella sp. 330]|nr:hypothetical protein FRB96_003247 [Tulasnella sp. 330]
MSQVLRFQSLLHSRPARSDSIITIRQAVKTNKQAARNFALCTGRPMDATPRPLENVGAQRINTKLKNAVAEFHEALRQVVADMGKLRPRSLRERMVCYGHDPMKSIALKERIQNAIEMIKIQLEAVLSTRMVLEGIERQLQLIRKLGTGDNGAADTEKDDEEGMCLGGTSEDILARIDQWIEEPSYDGSIFYAQSRGGMWEELHRKDDREAGQGRVKMSIARAVNAEPDIAYLSTTDQYRKLIHEPLITLNTAKLFIVLDDVDECEEEFTTKLLKQICLDYTNLPIEIKFLIASRSDRCIRNNLESPSVNPTVERLIIGFEDPAAVDMDIILYPKDCLTRVAEEYDIDGLAWGSKAKHSCWNGSLYSSVLTVYPSRTALMWKVLGALVAARTPLDIGTLASLLPSKPGSKQIPPKIIHTKALSRLEAVPKVRSGDELHSSKPAQFLHQSFVDLLITKGWYERRFLLNVADHLEQIAIPTLS